MRRHPIGATGTVVAALLLLEGDAFAASDTVVVTTAAADVKAGDKLLAQVIQGQRFPVKEVRGEWYRIEFETDGRRQTGWIHQDQVRFEPAGERYALLVGVGDYDPKQLQKLPFARNDVTEFRDVLLDSGFKKENVTLMLDDPRNPVPPRLLPEAAKIRKQLALMLAGREEDDTVILAFTGHGVQFKGDDTNYFCPLDADLESKETLIPLKEVYDSLKACGAKKKLLLVDACRNDPRTAVARSRARVDLESITRPQKLAVPENVVAFFSCAAGQQSFEWPELNHGVFFYHLLDVWKNGAGDGRELTLDDMVSQTRRRTEAFARNTLEATQTPELQGKSAGNWVLRTYDFGEKAFTNSIGMKFVRIRPGEFQMGDPGATPQNDDPKHRVRITKPFYLGMHEVTLRDFRKFVDEQGDKTGPGVGYDAQSQTFAVNDRFNWRQTGWAQTDNHPVVNVSWHDADDFCRWLSKREGKTYRLPTEAEWEFACRGGTITTFSSGDSEDDLKGYANVADQSFKARLAGVFNQKGYYDYSKRWDDGFAFSAPVGSFKPNPLGLFDMHGNVQEWCADWYGEKYYRDSPLDDPQGPASGATRVKRGGDFVDYALVCRSHFRRSEVVPTSRSHFIGFRVARDAK